MFLLQDMFPVSKEFIKEMYIKNEKPYLVIKEEDREFLYKTALIIKNMIKHGVKFTSTMVDVKKIEKLMKK